ncbi:phage tail tape measure protein [Dielma fastidiosa]|uniref:Phage tail tape measure protein n=1 Tax=Dielma fastidiosa TaxID=1034346 RepID=A0AB35UMI4_9FIRM|nr:phage tail tape measure protein [Dielma fastidiosa]MDY5168608.1 phage tail tape measure protein [Dielma fastidiosa]
MSMESIFKLSMIMNLVDNMSTPLVRIRNESEQTITKLQQWENGMVSMAKTGFVISNIGRSFWDVGSDIALSSFDSQAALGELSSLGIENLDALTASANDFSNQWSGTTTPEFLTAAYDIKSGIASLSDQGVADMTELASLTAKATKATASEMTSLFATGYGIYKNYYDNLSDLEFGEMFSAGISKSVQQFKTTGQGMAQAISSLGGSATTAAVPLEEQLSILGMLQATMSAPEAGTKYKAFIRSAVKGGQELGLSFVDANNQMLPMTDILDLLHSKFGDVMDAAEKMELQKAFGDTESVALIDLLYNKTGDLNSNINAVANSMLQGVDATQQMADAINNTNPSKFELLQQKIQNTKETLSAAMMPTVEKFIDKGLKVADSLSNWIANNEQLAGTIMTCVIVLGGLLAVGGTGIAVFGAIGLAGAKSYEGLQLLYKGLKSLPGVISKSSTSLINLGGKLLTFGKNTAITAVGAAKNFVLSLAGMAKQAITTAVTAMPGLIASVWSFTAALLANPITWVIVGIIALIAALVLLWNNWDSVSQWISNAWQGACQGVQAGIDWIKSGINGIIDWFTGIPDKFAEFGSNIMNSLAGGIKAVAMAPFNAVSSVFDKVRNLLPFSDAKEGAFSHLTLSGQRIMTTISEGINQEEEAPAEAVKRSFSKVSLIHEETKKVNRSFFKTETEKVESKDESNENKGLTMHIGRIQLNVNLKDIEDIQKLKQLLAELSDLTDGADDPYPQGVPA